VAGDAAVAFLFFGQKLCFKGSGNYKLRPTPDQGLGWVNLTNKCSETPLQWLHLSCLARGTQLRLSGWLKVSLLGIRKSEHAALRSQWHRLILAMPHLT